MKYLKSFENARKEGYEYQDRDHYHRASDPKKHLHPKIENKVEQFVRDFIIKTGLEKIENLKFHNFENHQMSYFCVWMDEVLASQYYGPLNIYYEVDSFCRQERMDLNKSYSMPALRNSLSKIIGKMYKEFDVRNKLDKVLIDILQKKPDIYSYIYDNYKSELNNTVKKACEWMLDYRKYNL
jgi:hypothetical protein